MDHFYANNYEDNFKFDDCGDIIGKLENYEKPKVLLLLHAKSIAKLKRWETSARTPKTDAITNNERLQKYESTLKSINLFYLSERKNVQIHQIQTT